MRGHAPSRRSSLCARAAVAGATAALCLLSLVAVAQSDPFALRPEFVSQAVFSCGDVAMTGGSIVTAAGTAPEGHVVSNGKMTLNGSSVIRGNATAGPGKTITTTGLSRVVGTKGNLTSPWPCAPVDLAALATSLATSNDNARVPKTNKNRNPLSGTNPPTLWLYGAETLVLPAGTYYLDELKLDGSSTLSIAGDVRILAKGKVTLTGSSTVNLSGSPASLRVFTSSSAVALHGGSTMRGFVYASSTSASVTLDGGSAMSGGVYGGRLTLNGSAKVTRDLAAVPPPEPLAIAVTESGQPLVEGAVYARAVTPVVSTTGGTPPVTVAATLDGVSWTPGSAISADGDHTLVVSATDSGTPVQSKTVTRHFRIDRQGPAIAVATPAAGALVAVPSVLVTGSAGDAVSLTLNALPVPLGAGGAFSVAVLLAEGTNPLRLVAFDAAGNQTVQVHPVVLDSLPPVLALSSPASGACLSAGSALAVSGRISDAHPRAAGAPEGPALSLTFTPPSGAAATIVATPDASGAFSATFPLAESSEGSATLLVTATDALGHSSRTLATVRVDGSDPAVTLLLDGAAFPGSGPGATPPAGTVPTLVNRAVTPRAAVSDGAATAPAAILTLNGQPFVAGTTVSDEGTYLLVASARDCAGRQGAAWASFTIDTTAPALSQTTPENGALLKDPVPTFSGTASNDLERASVAGRPAVVTPGPSASTFILDAFPWREGENSVSIELTDRAGNRAVHSRTFTVKTTGPLVEILVEGIPVGTGRTFLRAVTPEVRTNEPLSGPGAATLSVTLDGAPWTGGTAIASPGTHALVARVTDPTGRIAEATASFTIDATEGPSIAITAPSDGTMLPGPAVDVTGAVSAAHASGPTVVRVNGRPATVAGTTWVLAGLSLASDAPNEIVAVAVDGLGRSASASVQVLTRSDGPRILVLSPAEGARTNRKRIDVVGAVVGGAGATADGLVRAGALTASIDATGGFRLRDVPLSTGSNVITVSAVDSQGRTGSAVITVHSDSTSPSVAFTVAGQPLTDGSTFSGPTTVLVAVTDDDATPPKPRVTLNGAPVDTASATTEVVVPGAGGWLLSVVAGDAAGNETRASRSFVVDAGVCDLAEIRPSDGSTTAESKVTLVGRSGKASRVLVRVPQPGGVPQEYVASLADGTFAAGDVPLPSVGENALEVVCETPAGSAFSAPLHLHRLAGEGPSVSIAAPVSGTLVPGPSVALSGAVSDALADLYVNGARVGSGSRSGSSFSLSGVALTEGPNVLVARAIDRGGRAGEARVVVSRDSQAPRVALIWPTSGARFGKRGDAPPVVDVTGSVELSSEPNLRSVIASTPAGSVTAVVDPVTGAFRAEGLSLGAPGTRQVRVVATDAGGLSTTVEIDVLVDVEGPALKLDAPADLVRLTAASPSSISVTGEAWAAEGATVSVNGVSIDPATLAWEPAAADGRRHVAFSTSVAAPTQDGPFGLIVRVEDRQGRSASTRRLVVRDTVAPSVVEAIPVSGATGVDHNGVVLVLFSEEITRASLAAASGFALTRDGQPEPIVGTFFAAGSAIAFVPGAALSPGSTYRLSIGTGVVDVAGNPVGSAFTSTFTAAPALLGVAPAFDPAPPSVVCSSALELRGSAPPGATLRATDGDVSVTAVADAAGRFVLSLPFVGNGYHDVSVRVVGRDGTSGPAVHVLVRKDCSAPLVERAALDRVTGRLTVRFSERMDPSKLVLSTIAGDGASVLLSLESDPAATPRAGALSLQPDGQELAIDLPPAVDAWWRDEAVRLTVKPPAADERGNPLSAPWVTTFFPGAGPGDLSGGFLSGETYDDATGRPLDGVEARLYTSSSSLPGAVATPDTPTAVATTDARGRYGFFGDAVAGRYVLHLAKAGYAPVVRRLPLAPGTGVVPFDGRLTPLAPLAPSRLTPPSGGSFEGPDGLLLELDPNALVPAPEGSLGVRLTALSAQALPELLPLGWSPLAAADVRLEADGASPTALPQSARFASDAAHLTLPLPAETPSGSALVAVRHDLASGRWLTLGPVDRRAGPGGTDIARIALVSPGAIAVVLADTDADIAPPALPSGAGQPLTAANAPTQVPPFSATLVLTPPVVGPSGRSTARVVARSADGRVKWPSGTAVQAYLDEKLVLSGGGELYEAPFAVDLLLSHHPVSAQELGGAAPGTAGALSFVVSPSPKAAQVVLESGWENVRLYPFPESLERGSVLGGLGGTVASVDGVELTLPEGALAESVVVEAKLLSADELATLVPPAGYDLVTAVRVSLSGRTLARAATLSVPLPAATPEDPPAEARLLLAQLVPQPADGRGAFARLSARAAWAAGSRAVAAPEAVDSALPLEGLVEEGTYLLLRARAPLGFATGFVRIGNGNGLALARVAAPMLGTADLSRPGGRYAIPVPAGADRDVVAAHPQLDEKATARIAVLSPSAVVALDLLVRPVGPRVRSVEPGDRSSGQSIGAPLLVRFSEPIDPASVVPGLLVAELLAENGAATGALVNGRLELEADGATLVFKPTHPLPPGRRIRGRLGSGVRDVGGTPYEGELPYLWSFETAEQVNSGGQIDLAKIRLLLPENGTARVVGAAGAIPNGWSVSSSVENARPSPACPETWTNVDTTGAFSILAGCGSTPVTLSSRVFLKVVDTGNNSTVLPLGPYVSADGLAFVPQPGETTVYKTPEGVEVTVPAGAFDEAKVVRVAKKDPATLGVAFPPYLEVGAFVDVDFDGEARETLRLRLPVTTTAPVGTLVFAGTPIDLPWGRKLRLIDLARIVDGGGGAKVISNFEVDQPSDPSTNSGFMGAESIEPVLTSSGRTALSPPTKSIVKTALLEFTARAAAAFSYSIGAELSAITGSTIPNDVMRQNGVLFTEYADAMVFLPPPGSWDGRYILPAPAGQGFTVAAKDRATGWTIGQQTIDPIPGVPGTLVPISPFRDMEVAPPRLIDAAPFGLTRFSAPAPPKPGEDRVCLRLRLELSACASSDGLLTIEAETGYRLPVETRVLFQSLSIPGPALPARRVDENGSLGEAPLQLPARSGEDMLLTVSPGDLDPDGFDAFRLVFDKPLAPPKNPETVAHLYDCGALPGDCQAKPAEIPLELKTSGPFTDLTLPLQGVLPRGHLFRLVLDRTRLTKATNDPNGGSVYFGPSEYLFATRRGATGALSNSGDLALGDTNLARDLVKLGNLLFVASGSGRLIALDVSTSRDPASAPGMPTPFAIYARMDERFDEIRGLATDGHNRLFLNVRAGNTWGVKTVRLEDARNATFASCRQPLPEPSWMQGIPCFSAVEGTVRTALGVEGAILASEYVARVGTLAIGRPVGMEVLVHDDTTPELALPEFYEENKTVNAPPFHDLTYDAHGFATFKVMLNTANRLAQRPGGVCSNEAAHDRYQRVTIDNVTTGQSYSFDVENAWPGAAPPSANSGVLDVDGIRARQGDVLRIRYSTRAYGYLAILGSGVTVVDLNRFYRLPAAQAGALDTEGQCGRRLGVYEGTDLDFAPCRQPDGTNVPAPTSIQSPLALAVLAESVAEGKSSMPGLDVFVAQSRYGGVHASSSLDGPGHLIKADDPGCYMSASGKREIRTQLRSVAVVGKARWLDKGITLQDPLTATWSQPRPQSEWEERASSLAFFSLGPAGIYSFDVGTRRLGQPIGRYYKKDHWVTRVQVDERTSRLYAGGFDSVTSEPFIDVWDISRANGGPDPATQDTTADPRLLFTLDAPWETNHLAFDEAATGLLYTWGSADPGQPLRGHIVPVNDPEFVYSGLYVPQTDESAPAPGVPAPAGPLPVERVTTAFIPLGIPLRALPEDEKDPAKRKADEQLATAAFRVRVALPGDFGETLVAKVQSLRALPAQGLLGRDDVGALVAPPGGPGWPAAETFVTLRRLGTAAALEGAALPAGLTNTTYQGEKGRLGSLYNLYESKEVVLLLADPRARKAYWDTRQKLAGSESADEETQCRRCDRPTYLQRLIDDGRLVESDIKELLAAGPYLRAVLTSRKTDPFDTGISVPDDDGRTVRAEAFFASHSSVYRTPSGAARLVAWADEVPSPIQSSLKEPILNPASWDSGERGVSILLGGGEATLTAIDYAKAGRGLDIALDRTYRSGLLGFGPLGSAGWSSSLLQHLRRIPLYGEGKNPKASVSPRGAPTTLADLTDVPELVEYHDGAGHVFRFSTKVGAQCPAGTERDLDDGKETYCAPVGLYLRLQKLEGGQRYRLIGRQKSVLLFDGRGRLLEIRDRHRQNETDPVSQGNTHTLVYDAFGTLAQLEDDYGRVYRFEHFDDPRTDGEQYGLLKTFTDFVDRKLQYRWRQNPSIRDDRLLRQVVLPAVKSPLGPPYEHADPTLTYLYGTSELGASAPHHGPDFSRLRLRGFKLPGTAQGDPDRVHLEYEQPTGRLATLTIPGAVSWQLGQPTGPSAAPATKVEITAPWQHKVTYNLFPEGRLQNRVELLPTLVRGTAVTGVDVAPSVVSLQTDLTYLADGRLSTLETPDRLLTTLTYPPDTEPDRLARANVLARVETGLAREGSGECSDGDLSTTTRTTRKDYDPSNVLKTVQDPLSRKVTLPIPNVNDLSTPILFGIETGGSPIVGGIRAQSIFDIHARDLKTEGRPGESASPPVVAATGFYSDARGRAGKGYIKTATRGPMAESFEKYDAAGNLEKHSLGGVLSTRAFDEWDRVVSDEPGGSEGAYVPTGTKTLWAFDAAGHVLIEREVQSPLGFVDTLTTYNAREQVTAIRQTRLSDGAGRPTAEAVTTFSYDPYGRLATITSPAGVVTTYTYDEGGRVAAESTGSGSRRRLYDEMNRLVFTTDGHEGFSRGKYDAFGELYEERLPTGAVVKRCFDAGGNERRTRVFGASGTLLSDTQRDLTSFGAVAKLTEHLTAAQKRITTNEYDTNGRLLSVASGDGGALTRTDATFTYDSASRVVTKTDALGNVDKTVYDTGFYPSQHSVLETAGQPPLTTSIVSRDALGHVLQQADSAGRTVGRTFDERGNLTSLRTGGNPPTTYAWDGAGKLIASTLPHGGESVLGYDLDGRPVLRKVKAASSEWVTTHVYDPSRSGRLTSSTYPDGTSESYAAFDADDVPRLVTNRHGQSIARLVDEANRLRGLNPSGGPARLVNYGVSWEYDALSRPTVVTRVGEAASSVTREYDLGGRPSSTTLGTGAVLTPSWDVFSRPTSVAVSSASFGTPSFGRNFDVLDRAIRSEVTGSTAIPGASFGWGGRGNLTEIKTQGRPAFAQSRTYDAPGRVSSFGFASGTPWGEVAVTHRPGDSYMTGRTAPANGLFGHQDFSFTPDGRLRLTSARASTLEGFALTYGSADELLRTSLESGGDLRTLTAGPSGRIASRGGVAYAYDAAGERTEDDRFLYTWTWRGELSALQVKDQWPPKASGDAPVVSPFAGDKLFFEYDALGRLTARVHKGRLAQSTDPDSSRPFISRREYLWNGPVLLSEVEKDGQGALRWRRTLVPGPTGLDDAVQMRVEDFGSGTTPVLRDFSFVRDELGTVLGLVDEKAQEPSRGPPVVARYLYTPFGEAHVETGPELLSAAFDSTLTSLNGTPQNAPVPQQTVAGGVIFHFTLSLDPGTLAGGVSIERWNLSEGSWEAVPSGTFLLGLDQSDARNLLAVPLDCWAKTTRYRIRLTPTLKDELARAFQGPQGQSPFDAIIEVPADGVAPPIYGRTFPFEYDAIRAAGDTVGGRVPGGMNLLFAGMWCDPVSGLYYARARWLQPRDGSWLSEDPAGSVDSENRYAYVGWRPNEYTDPWGLVASVSKSGVIIGSRPDGSRYVINPGDDPVTALRILESDPEIHTAAAQEDLLKRARMSIPYSSGQRPGEALIGSRDSNPRAFTHLPSGGSWIEAALIATTGLPAQTREQEVASSVVRGVAAAAPAAAGVGARVKGGVGQAIQPASPPPALPEVVDVEGTLPSGPFLPGTNRRGEVTSRGSFWKATLEDAWETAAPGPSGGRVCPTCGGEVLVPPGTGTPRDWHGSHNPSWTKREFPPDVTRSEVRENYQEGVTLECPPCNIKRGNRDELR